MERRAIRGGRPPLPLLTVLIVVGSGVLGGLLIGFTTNGL